MIDQLQVVPKAQILENHMMGRSLASALQKASISRFASVHSWKCYQTQSTQ